MKCPEYMDPVQEWTAVEGKSAALVEEEVLLYHGTAYENIDGIVAEYLKAGSKEDRANRRAGWMFGKAVYLAEDSTKADEYANDGDEEDDHFMIICRAYTGRVLKESEPGNYDETIQKEDHDCVVAQRMFKEFVFYDERKVLPWWVVKYKIRTMDNRIPGGDRRAFT